MAAATRRSRCIHGCQGAEQRQGCGAFGTRDKPARLPASLLQVKGKVNSIALDKCSRCGLLFDRWALVGPPTRLPAQGPGAVNAGNTGAHAHD